MIAIACAILTVAVLVAVLVLAPWWLTAAALIFAGTALVTFGVLALDARHDPDGGDVVPIRGRRQ